MPFKIVRNDLTKMQVDAIVNTANEAPIYSSGLDSAVYKAAGEELLLAERKKIGFMEEGDVAITPGFNLPAQYIIHAVSPCYIDGTYEEEDLLRSCYRKSLDLAFSYDCSSIAFPLISTGNFGYPREEAMRIAVDEINAFLLRHEMLIYLVVFDANSTRLGKNLYPDLEAYIDYNYVCEKRKEEYGDPYFVSSNEECSDYDEFDIEQDFVDLTAPTQLDMSEFCLTKETVECKPKTLSIDEYYDFVDELESALSERMKHRTDTFQEYLMYLISIKGLSNAEVYKNAIISKQLFSKIKLNADYHPDKGTAMRLCLGAKLNLDETKDLLARAGFALSPCDKRDIIFSYFIERNIYDIIELDTILSDHDLPCFIE